MQERDDPVQESMKPRDMSNIGVAPIDSSVNSPVNAEDRATIFGNFADAASLEDLTQALALKKKASQVWAVGGGKGGVGKSLISSSLGVALSRMGQRVLAVDLDLGGANLHTTLGVDLPRQTLSDFLTGRVSQLEHCMVPTGIPNLSMISGAQDSTGVAQISLSQKIQLLNALAAIETDILLIDLGAGTGENTLDFFQFADTGLIILLPEPTSIENGYRFIKSAYYRRLLLSPRLQEMRSWVEAAMDGKNAEGIKTPSDLFRRVNALSPESGMHLKAVIESFQPKLIINQARTQTDIEIGFSVKAVCKKYFGINMDYIGYLDYDSAVWQAVRRKRPVMLEFPNSRLVSNFDRMVKYLIRNQTHQRDEFFR